MRLYHYTKFDTAISKILPSMQLRFNSLIGMNDPVENFRHYTNFEESIFEYGDLFDVVKAEKLQKQWKTLCFSIDKKTEDGVVEGDCLQRMWAQYGYNTGICLAIDYIKLKDENKKVIDDCDILDYKLDYNNYSLKILPHYPSLGKPNPNKKPTATDPFDVSKNALGKNRINQLFFTKNTDWEGESEYRFINHSTVNRDIFLSIKKSLEYVVLGVSFSKQYIPSVLKLITSEKIYGLKIDMNGNVSRERLPDKYY
jgi:hypothetical protein